MKARALLGLGAQSPWAGVVIAGAALSGCHPDEVTSPSRPDFVIEDAQHGEQATRNPHFYWLPPVVPAPKPAPSGTADASLLPNLRVEVCDLGTSRPTGTSCEGKPVIASFTSTLGTYGSGSAKTSGTSSAELVRYDAAAGQYIANWRTDKTPLSISRYYRLRVVVVAGERSFELGQADIDVVKSASDLKNYDTGNTIPLLDGRTLPVKFRAEIGALNLLPAAGGTTTVSDATGGTVATADGVVALTISSGALGESQVGISVAPVAESSLPPAPTLIPGTTYDFGPDGTTFDTPVTLSIGYDPAKLPAGVEERALGLFTVVAGTWEPVPFGAVDRVKHSVTGPVSHFSEYAVQGEAAVETIRFIRLPFILASRFTALDLRSRESRDLYIILQDIDGNLLYGRPVTVLTSDPSVVTVDTVELSDREFGLTGEEAAMVRVTPRMLGTVTLTAISEERSAVVTLRILPFAAAIIPNPVAVGVGESVQLAVDLRDEVGNPLSAPAVWRTFDPATATVSQDGVLAGIATGRTTIEGTSAGLTVTASVTVGSPAPTPGFVNSGIEVLSNRQGSVCVIKTGGIAYCWGYNQDGQMGDGTVVNRPKPVPVFGSLRFTDITASDQVCGLTVAGTEYCWGFGAGGSLGNGTSESKTVPTPVAGGLTFTGIAQSRAGACAVTSAGQAYCWGYNMFGQLGTSRSDATCSAGPCDPTPVPIEGMLTFKLISKANHACGITTSDDLYCWGNNESGQVGDGTTTNRSGPVPVSSGVKFRYVSANGNHTCAIAVNGQATCWGQNQSGQLGDGTTIERHTPVPVSGDLLFSDISVGNGLYTCGVTTDGAGFCWGDNASGKLGNGTQSSSMVPVPVSGGLTFKAIGAGISTCGLTTAGSVYCWGDNGRGGQLGTGTGQNSSVPVPVANN
jgi:alpha-tubulin suppressor-like RCC1 family protein